MVDVGFSITLTTDVELCSVAVDDDVVEVVVPPTFEEVVPGVVPGVSNVVDGAINKVVVVNVVPTVKDRQNNSSEVSLISLVSLVSLVSSVDDARISDGVFVPFFGACSDVFVASPEEDDVAEGTETTSSTTAGLAMFAMVTMNDSPKVASMLVATALCRVPMFDACNLCPTSVPVTSIVSGASPPTTMA